MSRLACIILTQTTLDGRHIVSVSEPGGNSASAIATGTPGAATGVMVQQVKRLVLRGKSTERHLLLSVVL